MLIVLVGGLVSSRIEAAPGADGGKTLRRSPQARISVTLAPGVMIPFKKYLDFGSAPDTYSMENGAGFAFSLMVTLNNAELRWSYAALGAGRVSGRIPDGAFGELQGLGLNVGQTIDIDAPSALIFHNLTLGYRIRFFPTSKLEVSVPFGLGIVIAKPPSFGVINYSLFGFGAHAGVLGELRVAGMIGVGLDARFSFYITEPDPNLAGAGIAATKKVFDNAIAWLPALSIAAYARFHY